MTIAGSGVTRKLAQGSALVIALGLSGCATSPDTAQNTTARMAPETSLQFDGIEQALLAQNFDGARTQLQALSATRLSPTAQAEWYLLSAQLLLEEGNPDGARDQLNAFERYANDSTDEQQYRAALLNAEILETNQQWLAAARERDFISAVLPQEQQLTNRDQLWANLMALPHADLMARAENAMDTRFGGWLTLAALSRNHQLTLDDQLAAIQDWQLLHPDHPAAMQLPGALAMLEDLAASRPEQVSLMLPLSGALGRTGQAIRDGFMAAWYETYSKGYPVPAISVVDRAELGSLEQGYAAAIQAGSQWVVGPLSKVDVQLLAEQPQLPLPTLALNYANELTSITPPQQLFQFGLAAEDEAIQIAEQAWQDGHRRALVMIPEGAWGDRIMSAFEQHWETLGGDIEEVRRYPRAKDYNPDISALLNVDRSKERYRTIRSLMRQPVEFEPRRRQDADWLFLVALPDQARQIKPTLAFNFASDLPVYATSHVFSGVENLRADRDLNGIYFCDTPWLLRPSELKTQVDDATGGQGSYARLYAMGADAFRLVARVKQLQAFPESQLYGSTGALTLDTQQRLRRQTECTRFKRGAPVLLSQEATLSNNESASLTTE